MPLDRAELVRKLVHVAFGAVAGLLRWLSWPEAALLAAGALLFNWRVFPLVGGRALWRPGRGRYDAGILLYPAAVFALVLVFHDRLWAAAAIWGVLGWGDGMATLAGRGLGGPRLPWNRDKTWAGLGAFVVFGAAAAAALIVWTAPLPCSAAATPWVLGGSLVLAAACALAESLPVEVDDNLTVPVVGALVMAAWVAAKGGPPG